MVTQEIPERVRSLSQGLVGVDPHGIDGDGSTYLSGPIHGPGLFVGGEDPGVQFLTRPTDVQYVPRWLTDAFLPPSSRDHVGCGGAIGGDGIGRAR